MNSGLLLTWKLDILGVSVELLLIIGVIMFLKEWLIGLLMDIQCCNTIKVRKNCLAYCVKNKGHFGKCKTNDGVSFKSN